MATKADRGTNLLESWMTIPVSKRLWFYTGGLNGYYLTDDGTDFSIHDHDNHELFSLNYARQPTIQGGVSLATATPPQEFDLPMVEGVTSVGASYKNAYSKDQFGIVRVWFSVHFESIPDINAPVFTLPVGFRPDSICYGYAILSMTEHFPAGIYMGSDGIARVNHGTIAQTGPINLHGFIEFPDG